MKKETYNSLKEKAETLSKLINGGKGSGNFGHGGRPGKVGGSSHSGGFSKGQSVEVEYGGGKSKAKVLRKLSDKEKKDRAFLANPDAGDYYEVETDSGYKTIVWGAKIKDAGGNSKQASSKAEKELKDSKAKVDELEKSLKDLDKEGVPFTAPRYWSTYDDYKKAKADYLKKAAEYQKSGEAKKEIDRIAKKDGGKAESDKTKLALQISGVNTRIRGLSDRISALEAGIKDDMAKGYTDSLKRDKAVLKDLKKQLTEAKKDKTEYEKARKKITEK